MSMQRREGTYFCKSCRRAGFSEPGMKGPPGWYVVSQKSNDPSTRDRLHGFVCSLTCLQEMVDTMQYLAKKERQEHEATTEREL